MQQQYAVDKAGNVWDNSDPANPKFVSGAQAATAQSGSIFTLPPSPEEVRDNARQDRTERRQERSDLRADTTANRSAGADERTAQNMSFDNVMKLRGAYEASPVVKEYRVGISSLGAALNRAGDPTGDVALIYDYAKAMDPGSVVREAEMGMAASGASLIESAAADYKKKFGIEGGGTLSPGLREKLKREIATKVASQNKAYSAQRVRYAEDARAGGIDPRNVTGDHDGDVYMPQIKAYQDEQRDGQPSDLRTEAASGQVAAPDKATGIINSLMTSGPRGTPASKAMIDASLKNAGYDPISIQQYNAGKAWVKDNPGQKYTGGEVVLRPGYEQSVAGQGMSGVNEGLASVAGLPVDFATGAINLGSRGINALANTDIPMIENPTLGSEWIKDKMGGGFIYDPTDDPTQQFARRMGQSVGASAVPAGMAGSLGRAGGQLLAGATGGAGGATAQQLFPGNPLAEMAGELAGGATAAGGIMRAGQRNATRQIEAAVPTIPQLKDEAGQLYRAAEARGVVADPAMTQELSDNFRAALAAEGRISPNGRISEVYPKAREATQLIDDYAGQTMTPTQMQTVRKVASDGLSSPDNTERRLGGILTDVFDEWANPLAPELSDARDVSSRYLTAETLGRSRELAGARAGQFTGSGFENALRTEYRGLDRAAIKGNKHFSDDVTDAIETVSRGTPTSNLARGMGKLYPSGVVSGALGSGLPAILMGMATSSPLVGGAVGVGMAGIGGVGRAAATNMGIRAADQAELIARNGGALPTAQFSNPEIVKMLQQLALAESGKYLGQ